jgi:hypothetical protein
MLDEDCPNGCFELISACYIVCPHQSQDEAHLLLQLSQLGEERLVG